MCVFVCVCKVDGCGSVHNTARGLLIHKRKRHLSTLRTDDTMSVSVVQTDDVSSINSGNISVSNVDSMTSRVRRSLRIQNKNDRINVLESESNVRNTETVIDAGRNNWRQHKATNTRRDDLKKSFSRQIAEAEKQFLPKNKVIPQNDLLYNRLKECHDALLKTASTTTTEKLASKVVDVLLSPVVIDDCDRWFVWSTDDEKRLNELNIT